METQQEWSWEEVEDVWTDPTDLRRPSAFHLLKPVLHGRSTSYFTGEEAPTGLNVEELLSRPLSSGERIMVRAAVNLFNGQTEVDLSDAGAVLDDRNWSRFLEALKMYRAAMKRGPR